MAGSIARALARIKADVRSALPDASIEQACARARHAWRERLLGPAATVHLFVLQVMCFNTAIRHLRHLAGSPGQRRGLLPGAHAVAAGEEENGTSLIALDLGN
jgi:hypothetical protein